MRLFLTLAFVAVFSLLTSAQYNLVWEDNFNGTTLDSSIWNIEDRIGIWNTGGNNEFQHYKKENVSVGDDGDGNGCLILTAKREDYNGYHFTSGKVSTKGKFAFRRGKLVANIKIPDLANGLWPAFWTLGYVDTGWPDQGEIDVLEMGHEAGINQGVQNSFIGSHLFWGPYPADYGEEYVAPYDLTTGYFKHTVIWDEEKIATYFHDETNPYFVMGIDGDGTEEYRDYLHYIILNLAVGGSVPGVYNVNDITADFPATMYVDWVKVYQEEEKEDLGETEMPVFGSFGIYEEDPNVEMAMDLGFDLFEKRFGLTESTGSPYSGSKVLAYDVLESYELRLESAINRNMSNYANGTVQFYMKTDMESEIQVGVSDWNGNLAFILVDSLVKRDNSWQIVNLNLADVSAKVDLSKLKDMLIVKGTPDKTGTLAIDEVLYKEKAPVVTGVYGIYTNNSNITDQFDIDQVNGNIFNWSNTVAFNEVYPAYDGEQVLSLKSSGAAGWWGFGIHSEAPLNLSTFADGYLHFMTRTESSNSFNIGIESENGSGEVEIKSGVLGFDNDGKWHHMAIPLSDLTDQGLDLTSITIVLKLVGSSIGNVAVDDVYLSNSADPLENPMKCYPTSLSISPSSKTMKADRTQKFSAAAKDQFDNKTDAYVEWFSNGGSIDMEGVFTPDEVGEYLVWASLGEIADTAVVIVEKATGVNDLENEIQYFVADQNLYITGIQSPSQLLVSDLSGRIYIRENVTEEQSQTSLGMLPKSVYIVNLINGKEKIAFKIFK